MPEGTFIKVRCKQFSPSRKTCVFYVENNEGLPLAHIRWHAPWRRYVLQPLDDTLYDASCLTEIAARLTQLTQERDEKRYLPGELV